MSEHSRWEMSNGAPKNKLWHHTKKTHFPGFAKNFRRPWMKLKIFFCQFPHPWTLRVSGMGGYTSKCEKKSKSLHPNEQSLLLYSDCKFYEQPSPSCRRLTFLQCSVYEQPLLLQTVLFLCSVDEAWCCCAEFINSHFCYSQNFLLCRVYEQPIQLQHKHNLFTVQSL